MNFSVIGMEFGPRDNVEEHRFLRRIVPLDLRPAHTFRLQTVLIGVVRSGPSDMKQNHFRISVSRRVAVSWQPRKPDISLLRYICGAA